MNAAPRRGKPPRQATQWGVILAALLLLATWLVITMKVLPSQLQGMSKQLGSSSDISGLDEEEEDALEAEAMVHFHADSAPRSPPPPPITMAAILGNLTGFLNELHRAYQALEPGPDPEYLWVMYKDIADRWLLPLDRAYTGRGFFPVRDDDSIFVSVAAYRDELCGNTLKQMFSKADAPERIFVGLVQQNCRKDCKTGVLEGGDVIDAPPDSDCYDVFCESDEGHSMCAKGHVRHLFVDEAESLGPAVARYFASKLWQGETYFMQIDSHSLFEQGWDTSHVQDLKKTPSFPKSVLSHYPPDTQEGYQGTSGRRICDAAFSTDPIESHIVRLGGGQPNEDVGIMPEPCPAPFIGAGFMFAHASFLKDAPYDPYVPWVFMGEEILLSMRLWTWGFDIYSPTRNMISHYYVREHKPKFWETVGRLFKTPGIHNDIHDVMIQRVKRVVDYPECSEEILRPKSLGAYLDLYGEGPVRPMDLYMRNVGLDMSAKRNIPITWCFKCQAPHPVM